MLGVALVAVCASAGGFPDRSQDVDARLASLTADYFLPDGDILETYRNLSAADRRSYRDEVVYARMMATDLRFATFKKAIYNEGVATNLSLDIIGVGLGAAGAATTVESTSRILSALSGGIAGSTTAVNKNLYYERTLPALIALMDAERERIKADIFEGLGNSVDDYPLGQALVDLERYFEVGSIPGAIAAITTTAGQTKDMAGDRLAAVRTAAFTTTAARQRVDKLLDAVDSLPRDAAWRILQNPPSRLDPFIAAAVTARLGGRPLAQAFDLLAGSAAADARGKALLKMVLVLIDDRSAANLAKWEAAIKAQSDGG